MSNVALTLASESCPHNTVVSEYVNYDPQHRVVGLSC